MMEKQHECQLLTYIHTQTLTHTHTHKLTHSQHKTHTSIAQNFHCLDTVTTQYFILVEAVVKTIVSRFFFQFVCHLYRKSTDLCELILYLATMPKASIICRSFLVEFQGSLCILLYHLKIKILVFSCPDCISFLFLSCLFALAKIQLDKICDHYGDGPLRISVEYYFGYVN